MFFSRKDDDGLLYVATSGEYSDYRVDGVFSTYAKAIKHGEQVFVVKLDEPHAKVGAFACYMCESPTTSHYSAPAHRYKSNTKFVPGDIIDVSWSDGTPVDTPPGTGYSKTIVAYGHSKEAAIRAAATFLGFRKTLPWYAEAVWPSYRYREPPQEPVTRTTCGSKADWNNDNAEFWADAHGAIGVTEDDALAKVLQAAGPPLYEQKFSSHTTLGLLPVWVRQDANVVQDSAGYPITRYD